MEYFRFPRTPHLTWLGDGVPRGDKLLSPQEAEELLSHVVVVEEKVDGANIGISLSAGNELRVRKSWRLSRVGLLAPAVQAPSPMAPSSSSCAH